MKSYVNKTKGKISRDKRLNNVSDCIKSIPFDLVLGQQTRAQIEASIKTMMRVYISEAYIKTAPVFSSIFAGFSENYDDSLLETIAEDMIEDMYGRRSRWSKKLISNKNYVNCFLEQCVQMYSRKYYSGEVEISESALAAMTRIEESQMRYKYPDNDWLRNYFSQSSIEDHELPHRELTLEDMPYETFFDIPDDVVNELYPLAAETASEATFATDLISFEDKQKAVQELIVRRFYLNSLLYDDMGERMFLPQPEDGPVSVPIEKPPGSLSVYVKRSNKFFRLFTRLFTVRLMKKECIMLFKELLKEEFKYIVNSMANSIDAGLPSNAAYFHERKYVLR